MKQWLAIVAAVAFLALPVMVSAYEDDGTVIPPEANWSPTPPTPGVVAVPQKRVVSTTLEQASDSPRPAAIGRSTMPVALTPADAIYQAVNESAMAE